MSDTNFLTVKGDPNGSPSWRQRRADDNGKWGPIDVDDHRWLAQQGIVLYVFLDGEDVTQETIFADDRVNIVIGYTKDVNGRYVVNYDLGELVKTVRHGIVVITEHPSQEDYDAGPETSIAEKSLDILEAFLNLARDCNWRRSSP